MRYIALGLAETILHTHGRLRVFPLLDDGVATSEAAGAAFQAAGVVERLLAILVTLVQRSGANQDELVELFVRRILNELDMCIGLIDFVLVQRSWQM